MKLYVGVRSTMLALCTFLRAFKNSLSKNPCTMPSPHTWTVYLHRRYDLSLRSVSTARPLTESERVSLSSKGRLSGADSCGHPGLWSTTSWPRGHCLALFCITPLAGPALRVEVSCRFYCQPLLESSLSLTRPVLVVCAAA